MSLTDSKTYIEEVSLEGSCATIIDLPRQSSFFSAYRSLGNTAAFITADSLALFISYYCAGAVRTLTLGDSVLPSWIYLAIPFWWLLSSMNGLLPGWGLGAVDILRRQILQLTAFFALTAGLLFLTSASQSVSRLSLSLAWLLSLVLLPFFRSLTRWTLCKARAYGVTAVIYGQQSEVDLIIERLNFEKGLGYTPIAVACPSPFVSFQRLTVIKEFQAKTAYGSVAIIAQKGLNAAVYTTLISEALKSYSKVLVIPNIGDTPSLWVAPRDLSGQLGLEIHQHLFNPFSTLLKRSTDLLLVCTTLPLWAPLCGLLAALIWLEDRHSPVYRQQRVGRAGKLFNTLKFRTMVPDAESVLKDHLGSNSVLRAEWETHFKLQKDPRITSLGRFLRKTSLDELPQLINVLRGDMSLVGPRPLPFYHYEQLPVSVREQRERMRPGVTGLWQVSGRSDSGNAGMIRWDPYYVMNWSIWLDLVILVRTVRVVLMGSGAR